MDQESVSLTITMTTVVPGLTNLRMRGMYLINHTKRNEDSVFAHSSRNRQEKIDDIRL